MQDKVKKRFEVLKCDIRKGNPSLTGISSLPSYEIPENGTEGTPPETVMKWTGHSDYKSMKPYVDIAEKEKDAAMNAIDEQLQIILNDGITGETGDAIS